MIRPEHPGACREKPGGSLKTGSGEVRKRGRDNPLVFPLN